MKLNCLPSPRHVGLFTLAGDTNNFAKAARTRTVQAGTKKTRVFTARKPKKLNCHRVGNFWLDDDGKNLILIGQNFKNLFGKFLKLRFYL
jgi:hypothetical protein